MATNLELRDVEPERRFTKDEVGRKVMETAQTMAAGYEQAISAFQTDAENDASQKCSIAVNNVAYFILLGMGFSKDEIKVLAAAYRHEARQSTTTLRSP